MSDKSIKVDQRIDENLDSVLRASGSALKHYTLPGTLEAMRGAMRNIMSDSYLAGSDACHRAYVDLQKRAGK